MSALSAASISQTSLPTPRKDDSFEWRFVGAADALELASGDDIEACSLLAEEAQDGQRGVCFDCVADSVCAVLKGLWEELERVGDLVRWNRRKEECRGRRPRVRLYAVAVESAVAVGEGRAGVARDFLRNLFLFFFFKTWRSLLNCGCCDRSARSLWLRSGQALRLRRTRLAGHAPLRMTQFIA